MSSQSALSHAAALARAGRMEEAEQLCLRTLLADPNNLETRIFIGSLQMQSGRPIEAEQSFREAVQMAPASVAALFGRAAALQSLGRMPDALAALDTAVGSNPGNPLAWFNRGAARLWAQEFAAAESDFTRALELKPGAARFLELRGAARLHQGAQRAAEAVADFEAALSCNPRNPANWHMLGRAFAVQGAIPEALSSWDRALEIAPQYGDALMDRGFLLSAQQRHAEALADFEHVIAARPDHPGGWLGRGIVLAALNHEADAIASFTEALRLRPADPLALYNRAVVLSAAKQFDEAAADLEQLLRIAPDYPLARGLLINARLQNCDWRDLESQRRQTADALNRGVQAIHPFGHLVISESPSEQLSSACLQSVRACPAAKIPLSSGQSHAHSKIRIVYVSGDYFEHAVPYLIAGVWEHHDRNRFEIHALSYGPNDLGPTRQRLEQAVDRFIDMPGQPDTAIAQTIRELEAGIAVDLKGHTGRARPGIFAHRPAPVQVNYLGYPGTMGADYFDYLVADRIVIPPEHRAFYSEQVVWLPDSYQANDDRRLISSVPGQRSDESLPGSAFVFCCFNGSHKILPETFAIWMRILSAAENSVLWLLENTPRATANLRLEAQSRGIAPDRLIFARQVPLSEHLARLSLADVVLDTLPYGAHTTASDSLWAGVPVLTRLGTTFAGRVGASLLTAIGLPQLIAHSAGEYENLALRVYRDRAWLHELRAQLARNRGTMPLFDTRRITRNLEAAYTEMWERCRRGEAPAAFAVTPQD